MCKVGALLVSYFWILFGKSGTTSSHSSRAIKMHFVLLTRCYTLAQNGENSCWKNHGHIWLAPMAVGAPRNTRRWGNGVCRAFLGLAGYVERGGSSHMSGPWYRCLYRYCLISSINRHFLNILYWEKTLR